MGELQLGQLQEKWEPVFRPRLPQKNDIQFNDATHHAAPEPALHPNADSNLHGHPDEGNILDHQGGNAGQSLAYSRDRNSADKMVCN